MSKIKEISFKTLDNRFDIPTKSAFGEPSPKVIKNKYGYIIRIVVSKSLNHVRGTCRISFDWFELDETGLIIKAPRGYAKEYSKKVRVVDLDKYTKELEK